MYEDCLRFYNISFIDLASAFHATNFNYAQYQRDIFTAEGFNRVSQNVRILWAVASEIFF